MSSKIDAAIPGLVSQALTADCRVVRPLGMSQTPSLFSSVVQLDTNEIGTGVWTGVGTDVGRVGVFVGAFVGDLDGDLAHRAITGSH